MFGLMTNHRLAVTSKDTIVYGGTMMDDTNKPEFLQKLYSLFQLEPDKRSFALLDLGCSSGRMVEQTIQDGHFAAGLEGADYSLARQRSSWGRIPHNLFTCDVTKPFTLYSEKVLEHTHQIVPFRFDVITAWELLEHLPVRESLDQFIENVKRHLIADGYFMVSVSTQPGYHHETVRSHGWWLEYFESKGLVNCKSVWHKIDGDWPRGPGDPSSFNLALVRKVVHPE